MRWNARSTQTATGSWQPSRPCCSVSRRASSCSELAELPEVDRRNPPPPPPGLLVGLPAGLPAWPGGNRRRIVRSEVRGLSVATPATGGEVGGDGVVGRCCCCCCCCCCCGCGGFEAGADGEAIDAAPAAPADRLAG